MKKDETKRAYRQTARAESAEANAARIVAAFRARLVRGWFGEIRLEDVARDAGVTVQTVIRRFGGKEGLLAATVDTLSVEINDQRRTTPGDPPAAVRALLEDYEANGELYMRLLVQEDRYPALHIFTDRGRAEHRRWVVETFAPWLEGLSEPAARRRADALVVATDIYVWQLIRRDMGRPLAELSALMERLIADIVTHTLEPSDDQG
jgi:AcrR family transcriptional regulator